MVEQTTLPAATALEGIVDAKAKLADDQHLNASINDFLNRYTPAIPNPTPDMLGGRFKIDLNTPLPYYNTKNATAYAASDMTDTSKPLYALVCKPGSVQRHRVLNMLKSTEHENIVALRAAGVVMLSRGDEQRFVLFYVRPSGKKLSELFASAGGNINESFIRRNILSPLITAINHLSELGVSHGAINPDNIYYGDVPMIGDCVSEPCGYSQPFYFEPLERMQALTAAKGEGSTSQDNYALAVLTLYLLYGPNHFAGYTPETLQRRILRDGPYAALMRGKEPPETFNDLLRGLLSNNAHERWNFRSLKHWLEGKRSNVMIPVAPSETSRAFEFEGAQIVTRRELSHMLFTHWAKAQELMRTDALIQWVIQGLRNKELSEALKHSKRVILETNIKNEIQIHEQIARMLITFDPQGPMRINTLSFHIDGMDALCVELFNNNAVPELKLLAKFIEHSMANYWADIQRRTPDYVLPETVNSMFLKLDRLRLFIRNQSQGFGIERMLYELNPELPCQSPLLSRWHVNTLPALLLRLDQLAPSLPKGNDTIDRHIAAFITAKLGTLHEVKLPELAPHPSLANNKAIQSLQLISMAQSRCGNMQVPGLTHLLAAQILPSFDVIRSKTLKARLKTLMVERAKSGFTQLMAELVVDSNYAVADVSGLGRARATYHNNIARIEFYKKDQVIDEYSVQVGHSIAKGIAYVSLLVTIFALWS